MVDVQNILASPPNFASSPASPVSMSRSPSTPNKRNVIVTIKPRTLKDTKSRISEVSKDELNKRIQMDSKYFGQLL